MLKQLIDPTTNAGTARWVALGLFGYDLVRHGVNWANAAALLALGGVELAARFLQSQGPQAPGPECPA
jgi:hypothetical protein